MFIIIHTRYYIFMRDKQKYTYMYKHTKQASIAFKAKAKASNKGNKQKTKKHLTKNFFLELRSRVKVWVYIARMGANRCEKGFSFMTCQKPQRAPRLSPQAAWEHEALQ